MKSFEINPFYFLAIFYICINFFYAILGYQCGEMEIEFERKVIDNINFVYAFLFQLFSISILLLSYWVISKNDFKNREIIFNDRVGLFLLLGQFFYFITNIYFGANIAGDISEYKGNFLINILFILLPFDILFFILGICLRSSKLFFLNSILYLISNLVRGWMGAPLLLLFAILCRKEAIKLNFRNISFAIVVLILIIFILPYLIELKWFVRGEGGDVSIVENVKNYGYLNYLSNAIDYVFNRFQHVGHVALIIENQNFLNEKYNLGYIVPYWGEGLPQSIFMNVFNINSFMTLPRFLTIYSFSAPSSMSWTVNVGLAGWFVILKAKIIFFLLYIFSIVCIPFYFVSRYGNGRLLLMLSCFSLFYLFHGWLYAYITFLFYLLIVIFISRVKI